MYLDKYLLLVIDHNMEVYLYLNGRQKFFGKNIHINTSLQQLKKKSLPRKDNYMEYLTHY